MLHFKGSDLKVGKEEPSCFITPFIIELDVAKHCNLRKPFHNHTSIIFFKHEDIPSWRFFNLHRSDLMMKDQPVTVKYIYTHNFEINNEWTKLLFLGSMKGPRIAKPKERE